MPVTQSDEVKLTTPVTESGTILIPWGSEGDGHRPYGTETGP
jgi:hypothetical protein